MFDSKTPLTDSIWMYILWFATLPVGSPKSSRSESIVILFSFEFLPPRYCSYSTLSCLYRSVSGSNQTLPQVVIEIPHRMNGGKCISWKDLQEIAQLTKATNARLHMDGARLCEALPHFQEQEVARETLCGLFDSIYMSWCPGLTLWNFPICSSHFSGLTASTVVFRRIDLFTYIARFHTQLVGQLSWTAKVQRVWRNEWGFARDIKISYFFSIGLEGSLGWSRVHTGSTLDWCTRLATESARTVVFAVSKPPLTYIVYHCVQSFEIQWCLFGPWRQKSHSCIISQESSKAITTDEGHLVERVV